MKVIGFSNKFYTLWEVCTEHIDNQYETYDIEKHTYVKNVSFDKETALKLYPDAKLDLTLKGHSSFSVTKNYVPKLNYNEDCVQFGNDAGKKLYELDDDSLDWYFSHANDMQKDAATRVLEKYGYKRINEYVLATPTMVEKIENKFVMAEKVAEDIKEKRTMEYFCPKNLSYSNINYDLKLDKEDIKTIEDFIYETKGEENIKSLGDLSTVGLLEVTDNEYDDTKITLIFPNVKDMSYNGYCYALPIIDGKGKKIKGKIISIDEAECFISKDNYGWGPSTCILIKKFSIIA